MYDLNDLYYFVQVVDNEGFAAAGRKLDIPKSKLSRRVTLLEERLGVRLIHRSTRKFLVTEVGHSYYRHCVAMLAEANAAQAAIEHSRSEPQGIVRISCPPGLAAMGVSDTLARFMANYPKVTVYIDSTNRRVDILGEGYDIALRVRFPPLENVDLVVRVLGKSLQKLVAHPSLVPAEPALDIARLGKLPSVDLGPANHEHRWRLIDAQGQPFEVTHKPRLITSDLGTLLQAALEGVGVAQMPEIMVRDALQAGKLVEVLAGYTLRCGIIHAVFPSRRGLAPAVRLLIDQLAEDFGAVAVADPHASGT
ncbi:LysR substrate-binding domain-containing protein [Pseudomonas typographi]|uniref:LysR family transcriptional regulator n=1 Tax=Pseudomonas typographi TaxID=2715964 RepID=A0ABR7Z9A0_9PSED|nr:LysR substrate-binding domain-containing protein [Pseudomonas typographi]MBD1554836.1 LysR family transcriptional regulator [Pseudomonas typographi]MBD1589889.1 LysR family transcriptional regulator [Pseudomonas typographi]MBD1601883.1 LysR family transcriptional regulator [Pseudomonas typographi]